MFARSVLKLARPYLSEYTIAKRYKNPKTHWSRIAKQKTSSSKALEYFDEVYGDLYGKDWPSMRVALLSQSKYVALVNNYSDVDRIVTQLENLGAVDVRRAVEYEKERLEDNTSKKKKKSKTSKTPRPGSRVENVAERLASDELKNLYPEGADITDTTRSSAVLEGSSRLIDSSEDGTSALYQFVPATKLKGREDWISESDHFRYYDSATAATNSQLPLVIEEQSLLEFPPELKVYSFVAGCCDIFPKPKRSRLLEVTDYYLMDGASLLPILALDLSPGDNFLDMCAAPGGKSLVALQTLYLNIITMNDASMSRANRMQRVIQEFVFNCDEKVAEKTLRFTCNDGRNIEDTNLYNKILVDVPCTTDRHSVTEDDNNIFRPDRLQERIKIPEVQSALLVSALNLVKVGGTVVYSTCSLSPIQNDGVVNMALKTVHEKTSKRFAIIDMTKALEPTKVMFRYRSNVMKFGHQIVPYLPDNYGPMYFCKLVRLE